MSCATLRIAARSASSGTPVKSCSTTRATTNGISSVRAPVGAQLASSRTCSSVTFLPSQLRSTRLEHDADRDRQARDLADAGLLERGQRVEPAGGAGGELEFLEGVVAGCGVMCGLSRFVGCAAALGVLGAPIAAHVDLLAVGQRSCRPAAGPARHGADVLAVDDRRRLLRAHHRRVVGRVDARCGTRCRR